MDCLFCKIVAGDIPTTLLMEQDDIVAFRDIRPQAPTHVIVIPKRHIATINDTSPDDAYLLGRILLAGKQVAQTEGLNETGYRFVFNINSGGGQTVYHIHLHVIGGRQMTWPPG